MMTVGAKIGVDRSRAWSGPNDGSIVRARAAAAGRDFAPQ
jgi:hypothetical protein